MTEIRFHGRGGQGAVTSAQIFAQAVIEGGKYATAFPSFGSERRGAPVQAFMRISDEKIKVRTGIYEPDIVVVLDISLMKTVPITNGLKKDGLIVLNSRLEPLQWQKKLGVKNIVTVDATNIALQELGSPITNIVMLGALLKAKPLAKLDIVEGLIRERFVRIAEKEINAFRRAYKEARVMQ